MFRLESGDKLTHEMIRELILKFRGEELPRLKKLKDYYLNKTAILRRPCVDPSKPNNKVVHPFAQYITDTLVGYFVGEPITYTSNEDITNLKMIFEYNDEQDENVTLAKNCSIYGKAYELIYIDEDGNVRFVALDPREVIPVYGTSLDNELVGAIRFYMNRDLVSGLDEMIIEVYTDKEIVRYKTNDTVADLQFLDYKQHGFNDVPIVEYRNNDDCYGDYEGVITLIDAYDTLVSDDLNDFEYFVDAYLALYGYTAEPEDIAKMKQQRVLLMDNDSKAEWLVKKGDSQGVETTKERLERDIHKFSKTPNINDKNFGGNTSGVAMKYKLLGTENIASIKERKFKKGLQRRLELISGILSVLSRPSFDWMGVDITFTRNIPINEEDVANMIKNLNGIVSKKTLVSQLPFVEDIDQEMEQLNQELKQSIFFANPQLEEKEEITE
jgi:SPP1 family phage portal protein